SDPRFRLVRQIVGYYYYVECFRLGDVSVVFEEADLAQLETAKRLMQGVVHELVFHPNARLASTWQPWDGLLSSKPPPTVRGEDEQREAVREEPDGHDDEERGAALDQRQLSERPARAD